MLGLRLVSKRLINVSSIRLNALKSQQIIATFPKTLTESKLKDIFAQWKPSQLLYRAIHENNFAASKFSIINYRTVEECSEALEHFKNDPVIVENNLILNAYQPDPTKLYVGNITAEAKHAVYALFQDQISLRRYARIVFDSAETREEVLLHFKNESQQDEIELFSSDNSNAELNKKDSSKMQVYASFPQELSEAKLTEMFSKWNPNNVYYRVNKLDPKKFGLKSFAMIHYETTDLCLKALKKYSTHQFVHENQLIVRIALEDAKKLYIANILPHNRESVYELFEDQLAIRGHAYITFDSEEIREEALKHFSEVNEAGLRVTRVISH
jgi:hypothetical protein